MANRTMNRGGGPARGSASGRGARMTHGFNESGFMAKLENLPNITLTVPQDGDGDCTGTNSMPVDNSKPVDNSMPVATEGFEQSNIGGVNLPTEASGGFELSDSTNVGSTAGGAAFGSGGGGFPGRGGRGARGSSLVSHGVTPDFRDGNSVVRGDTSEGRGNSTFVRGTTSGNRVAVGARGGGRGGMRNEGSGGAAFPPANNGEDVELGGGKVEHNGGAQMREPNRSMGGSMSGARVDDRPRYVPAERNMASIFQEDIHAKELYANAFDVDEDVNVTGINEAPVRIEKWSEADLHSKVLKNIERAGYNRPRKIQSYAIPLILEGRDVKAQAETGSGKSAAFLIPIISKIARSRDSKQVVGMKNKPLCIIVEPTRELALQMYEQARKLADDTGVHAVKCYGEYDFKTNVQEVLNGCDIIVGTPGRLFQFLDEGIVDPTGLEYFVLDEADRLLDNSFHLMIEKMTKMALFPKKENRQTLLFSATFPQQIELLAASVQQPNPAVVTNARKSAPNAKVKQSFYAVANHDKKTKVVEMLKDELQKLRDQKPNAKQPRTLIFVETRRAADVTALFLCESQLPAATINGDRTQKLREEALADFREGTKPILVATDVCARGLDIKELDCVFNMDMPRDIETYIHRIGRTGRLETGIAVSFFDADNEQDQKLSHSLKRMLLEHGPLPVPEYIESAAASQHEVIVEDPILAAERIAKMKANDDAFTGAKPRGFPPKVAKVAEEVKPA